MDELIQSALLGYLSVMAILQTALMVCGLVIPTELRVKGLISRTLRACSRIFWTSITDSSRERLVWRAEVGLLTIITVVSWLGDNRLLCFIAAYLLGAYVFQAAMQLALPKRVVSSRAVL